MSLAPLSVIPPPFAPASDVTAFPRVIFTSFVTRVVLFKVVVVPLTTKLPLTLRLVKVPTLVMLGCAAVVTVPAVVEVAAFPVVF